MYITVNIKGFIKYWTDHANINSVPILALVSILPIFGLICPTRGENHDFSDPSEWDEVKKTNSFNINRLTQKIEN